MAEAEANWIRREDPDAWARIRRYLFLSGFLVHRLTGEFRRLGRRPGRLPPVRLQGAAAGRPPGDWKWQAVARRSRLAPASSSRRAGGWAGSRDAAAEATGIPRGPAAAGRGRRQGVRGARRRSARPADRRDLAGHDRDVQHHPPALRRGRSRSCRPTPPRSPARTRSRSRSTAATGWSSGSGASSAPREVGARPRQLGIDAGAAVRRAARGHAARGRWASSSSRTGRPACASPGPEAKGAVIGWGDVHTRAHLYRAILEGLAYALREGMERTAERTQGAGHARCGCRAAGRRARPRSSSPRTCSGCRRRGRTRTRRPASGPRSMPRSGSGIHPIVRGGRRGDDARRRDPGPGPGDAGPVRGPVPLASTCRLYDRLKPLYEEIRRITGYPPEA